MKRYRDHYDVTVMTLLKVKLSLGIPRLHNRPDQWTIDPSHKHQNASVPYLTMQHFVTEMCTWVHISVTNWCIVGYLSDALWDL